jgi:hypothetical protein
MRARKAIVVVLISLFAVPGPTAAIAASSLVEIFYLPHPPAEAVVKNLENVLKKYTQFEVEKYSFDDPKSRKLLTKYNLAEHVPVVIFINGQNQFAVGNKRIVLNNFPAGNSSFAPMFEGNWSYQDFEGILQAVTKGGLK